MERNGDRGEDRDGDAGRGSDALDVLQTVERLMCVIERVHGRICDLVGGDRHRFFNFNFLGALSLL